MGDPMNTAGIATKAGLLFAILFLVQRPSPVYSIDFLPPLVNIYKNLGKGKNKNHPVCSWGSL
jgi:hypothetical protein